MRRRDVDRDSSSGREGGPFAAGKQSGLFVVTGREEASAGGRWMLMRTDDGRWLVAAGNEREAMRVAEGESNQLGTREASNASSS